jgi:hypothetical protein
MITDKDSSKESTSCDEAQKENMDLSSRPDSTEQRNPDSTVTQPEMPSQQTGFTEDGEVEPLKETAETTLEGFGVEIEEQHGESKTDEERASSILADDRSEDSVSSSEAESEQGQLFPDVDDDQQTLGGETAHDRCLFDDTD